MTHPDTISPLGYFPKPPTIPKDITPADQAIYIPAVTDGYAMDIWDWIQNGAPRALPKGTTPADLNFLDPVNQTFRISHALTSAGQALGQKRDCIITRRNKGGTVIMADSGGYQIASGRLRVNSNADRLRILRWQEQFDIAVTLDVPTGPLRSPKPYAYATFADCLRETVDHLRFYRQNRSTEMVWLNVLQGNDEQQCDVWYDTVRKEFNGQGWAFAGPLRHNFFQLLRRVLVMCANGDLHEKRWIHVLGTSELETAVLLTALQRALNRHVNSKIRISYDTSSPFRALRSDRLFTLPTFDAKGMTMPMRKAPGSRTHVGCTLRWPWPSALGNRMVVGDVCVPMTGRRKYHRDKVSDWLIAHHNLSSLCWAIAQANRLFDVESLDHQYTTAYVVGSAAEVIEKVIKSGSMSELYNNQHILMALRHGSFDRDSEEQRDF
ncbi:MAG: hypothetical protein JSR61_16700 [Proteobacteria bacterium]|nr:hypothetical protein [Pseudomonadota bacterium]